MKTTMSLFISRNTITSTLLHLWMVLLLIGCSAAVPQNKVEIISQQEQERIVIFNYGPAAQNMAGWYALSPQGIHRVDFPRDYILAPQARVVIARTASRTDELVWTSNPSRPAAGQDACFTLFNAQGTKVSQSCQGSSCPTCGG